MEWPIISHALYVVEEHISAYSLNAAVCQGTLVAHVEIAMAQPRIPLL
jgi:hypothetical protein